MGESTPRGQPASLASQGARGPGCLGPTWTNLEGSPSFGAPQEAASALPGHVAIPSGPPARPAALPPPTGRAPKPSGQLPDPPDVKCVSQRPRPGAEPIALASKVLAPVPLASRVTAGCGCPPLPGPVCLQCPGHPRVARSPSPARPSPGSSVDSGRFLPPSPFACVSIYVEAASELSPEVPALR